MITVTSKDALRAEVLKPGWRVGECVTVTNKVAGTDGSALYVFGIEVEDNGLKYPLKDYQLSEKAISMGKNFFISCGFPPTEWDKLVKGESASANIDERECVGKKFKVNVINTIFNNKVQNEAGDFLPLSNPAQG